MVFSSDIVVILWFGALLATLAAVLLAGTWRAADRPPYLLAWAGFCALGALSLVMYALGGSLGMGLIANAVGLLSWALFWAGARLLRGRAARPWMVALPAAAWCAAFALPAFRDSLALHAALIAVLLAAMAMAAALQVLRLDGSAGLRRAARSLGIIVLVFAAVPVWRLVALAGDLPSPSGALLFVSGAMLFVAVAFAGLALASIETAERDAGSIAAAARRDAAALAAGRAEMLRLHDGLPALIYLRDVAPGGTSRLVYRGGDMEAVTGWSAEALAPYPNLDHLNGPVAAPTEGFVREVARDGSGTVDWQIRGPDGTLHWVRSNARCIARHPDGRAEVVGTVLNVDAEYRAADAVRGAQAREAAGRAQVDRLHAGLPALIFYREAEPDGTSRLLYRGGDMEAVTGWPTAAAAGHNSLDHLHGPGAWSIEDAMRAVMRDGIARNDWQLLRPDGSLNWMRTLSRRVAERPDGSAEVVGYILNVEAEYRAEAEQRAAQAREAVAEAAARAQMDRLHAGLPAVLFHRDCPPGTRSRPLYHGGDTEAVTGWPPARLDESNGIDDLVEGGSATFDAFEHRVLRDGAAVLDWRMRQPDGTQRWMRSHGRRVLLRPDGGGEVVGYLLDVSAEYAAAAATEAARAREAEALLAGRAQVERLHAGLPLVLFQRDVAADGTSRVLYRAGDLAGVLGWPPDAVAAMDSLEPLVIDSRSTFAAWLHQAMRDGIAVEEGRMRRADGTLRWMRCHARRLTQRPDGGGEVVGYIVDIQAERDAAAAAEAARLREAEAMLAGRAQMERLQAGLPAVLFQRDCAADGTSRLLYRGGDLEAVTGWPAATLAAMDSLAPLIVAPEFDLDAGLRAVLRDGAMREEWQLRQPDGSLRWMRCATQRLTQRPDGGGEVVGYIVDVTAERAAAAQAAELERTLDLAPVIVFRGRIAPDGGFTRTYLGRGIERATGWSWGQVNSLHGLGELLDPDSQANEAALMRRLLRDGQVADDVRLRHADGRWLWLRSSLAVVERLPGGGTEMIGFMVDVTAERAAEAAVADLDRTLAAAPAVVYRALVEADGSYTRTYLSRGITALTGWPWSHFADRPGALRDIMVFDGDLDRLAARRALDDGQTVHEMQLRCADGCLIWARHTIIGTLAAAGGGHEIIGFIADITAERAAREREAAALQAGRAQVERLLTGLPAIVYLREYTADGTSRLLSRGGDVATVTGWPAEAVATMDSLYHTLGAGAVGGLVHGEFLRTTRDAGYAVKEWQLRQPDGSFRWMREHARRLTLRADGGGEVVGYILDIGREREAAEQARVAEADLATTLAAAPLAVFRGRLDAEGRFTRTYLSRGIERLTGHSWTGLDRPGELVGLLEGCRQADEREAWLRLLRFGAGDFEYRMRHADGRWIPVRSRVVTVAPRPDGGAEVIGFIIDITPEREAQAREAAARAELDLTLAAAPLAVFRGRIAADGSLARSYLSRGIETLSGVAWEALQTPDGLPAMFDAASIGDVAAHTSRLLADGTLRLEHRLRHADGRWLDVRTTITILHPNDDGGVEVVGFIVDVSAERQALARAGAAARLASLGEMGTGLAHELKQPLATISLAAENAMTALRRGRAASVEQRLDRIVQQVQRAAGIIENLRRFARGAEEGVPPGPMAIGGAVQGALSLVGGTLRAAMIEVTVKLGTPPPVAHGQMVSLEQVLVNLLLNAADAIGGQPPGGPPVRQHAVRIAAWTAAGSVWVTVADTGGGIPAAILPRLFEPFVTSKDPDRGTGLGLSICHGLVTAMGGTIEAHNADGGAIFTVRLVAAPAAAGAAEVAAVAG